MMRWLVVLAVVCGAVVTARSRGADRRGTEDATVRRDMETAAVEEDIKRYGGARDAMEGPVTRKFDLGYDVEDFAVKGDEIWEVRMEKGDIVNGEARQELRAAYWVNAKTKKVLFLSGMKPREVGGFQQEAANLVKQWYEQSVGTLEANLSLEMSELVLGYTIEDFEGRGTRLVEVRISAPEGLRGIFWVSPNKGGKVRLVAGPWQTPVKAAPATGR